jgi:hypothetical protein
VRVIGRVSLALILKRLFVQYNEQYALSTSAGITTSYPKIVMRRMQGKTASDDDHAGFFLADPYARLGPTW